MRERYKKVILRIKLRFWMADMGIISNFQSDENGKRAVRKRAKPKKKKIFFDVE